MKPNALYALYAAVSIFLAGCAAVGPNYHAPVTSDPKNWSEAPAGGVTSAPMQVGEWWKTFNDPELESLIERAVKANYDLRLAEARLMEARANRSHAKWDFAPTVGTSASYTKQQTSGNLSTNSKANTSTVSQVYDTGFDATWEIDVFGSKRRSLEEASANYGASEENRRDTLITVLGDVARNYVEVRAAQNRLAIAHENIDSQKKTIELTRARFNAHLTSELDVRQAEALLASTEATIPQFETTLKQSIHALGVLLGQPPGALLAELSKDEPIPTTPPTVPIGLPSELLRRRPDIRSAERQLAAATADIGVQTAELFPKFSLVGTAGLQSVRASDWFTAGSGYWSAGPSITWRVLDFGRIQSEINAADARQQQALDTYEQTVLTAFQNVEDSLVAYTNEQTHYTALNDAVIANQRALELSQALYQEGVGDFLNVLDAERSLFAAQDQLADSRRAETEDLVSLYKALGGGWEAPQFAESTAAAR